MNDGQKLCKDCGQLLDLSKFQAQRLRCNDCLNAARRAKTRANANRLAYAREYGRRETACRQLMPDFLAVAQAVISGQPERAERMAQIAYSKALKAGIV